MIILDTQAWFWYMHSPDKLSSKAKIAIEEFEPQKSLRVSAISVWEIALKARIGKLTLPMEINAWYEKTQTYLAVTIESINPIDLINSIQLPDDFHKDPADRIIVAMARRYGCFLVTSDQKIIDYTQVQTIW